MLDYEGYVSETNATNIFMIKNNIVYTPYTSYCLPGITRSHIINICKTNNIPVQEKNISVDEIKNADEVFVTGTMGELTLVNKIDETDFTKNNSTSIFSNINSLFKKSTIELSENIL